MRITRGHEHWSSFTRLLVAGVLTACGGSSGATVTSNSSGGTTSRSDTNRTSDGGADVSAGTGGTASRAETGGATASGAAAGGAATGGAAADYPPAMLDPDYTYFGAGTRLTPLVRGIGEGVGILTGTWIDSELSTPCHFQPASDGETRCLPYNVGEANLHYAAADCSAAFVTFDPMHYCSNTIAEATGEYFTTLSACRYEMYRVSGPVTEPVPFQGPETSCSVRDATEFRDLTELFGVEYMPPERFVARHPVVEEEDRAPGLRVVRQEGDDGSWVVTGFRDSARDAACSALGDAYAEPGRCAPVPRMVVEEYVDAQCSQLGALRRGSETDECGELPELVPRALARAVPSEQECGLASIELYEVLDPVVTDRYESVGGSCNLVGDEPLETYPAGPPIDLSTLPLLEETTLGSEHLNVHFLTIDGVPLAPSSVLVDVETGEECSDQRFTDGVLRCVPRQTWTSSNVLFADATCSERPIISQGEVHDDACADVSQPRGILLTVTENNCSRVARAGWLEPFTGDTYYQRTRDACVPHAAADFADTLVLLQMGEEVDPDDVFGRVEVVEAR